MYVSVHQEEQTFPKKGKVVTALIFYKGKRAARANVNHLLKRR
jgi:hypothetical protein